MSLEKEELPSTGPLGAQQLRFIEEYIEDPSSVGAAARRAGYMSTYAQQIGKRILRDPRAQKIMDMAKDRAVKRLGLTTERVLQELAKIAFANPGSLIKTDAEGDEYIDSGILTGNSSQPVEVSVSSIKGSRGKVTNVQYRTVKISDKTAALQLLGKQLGMFKDQVEVTNKLSLLEMIEQSFKTPAAIADESNIIEGEVVENNEDNQSDETEESVIV